MKMPALPSSFWMKVPCCLCRALLFFPPVPILYALTARSAGRGVSLACLAVLILCMAGGAAFGNLCRRNWTAWTLHGVRLAAACAAGILAAALPFPGVLVSLYMAAAAFLSVWTGFNAARRSYADTLSDGIFKFFLAFYVISAVVCCLLQYVGYTPDIPLLTAVFLIGLGCVGIVRNQSNIDFLMERRHHRLEDLPPKIRRYNLRLTLTCLSAILLCLLLRGPIAAGLRVLWKGIGLLILLVFWILEQIGSLFALKPTSDAPMQAGPSFLPPVEDSTTDLSHWLLLAAAVILAVLVVRYRYAILQFFHNLWQHLTSLFRRLFSLPEPVPQSDETPYYRDRTEKIDRLEKHRRTTGFSMRGWKKSYRIYQRMEDGPDKYRTGYRLLLLWMESRRDDIQRSDTVREIYAKTQSLLPVTEYFLCCRDYEQVRYGEMKPPSDGIGALSHLLETIAQTNPRREAAKQPKSS